MVFSKNVVEITLPQMAVVDARRHIQRAFGIRRNVELITDQDGTSGWNGAVVGDRVDGPNLMIVHELAICIYRAIGEAVRSRVERAIRLKETAVVDFGSVAVFHLKLHPRLVQIADFRNERVADVLVLDDDHGLDRIVGLHLEGNGTEWRNESIGIGGVFRGP